MIRKRANYSRPDDLKIHLINVQAPLTHDVSRFASREQSDAFHREQSEKLLHDACELLAAASACYTSTRSAGSL